MPLWADNSLINYLSKHNILFRYVANFRYYDIKGTFVIVHLTCDDRKEIN